jgi:hypothetical protein
LEGFRRVPWRLAKYGCKEHCHISGHLLLARHKTTALRWDSMTFLWISSISPRLWETLRYSERFWRTLSSPLVGLYDVSMMFPWCFHDVIMGLWYFLMFLLFVFLNLCRSQCAASAMDGIDSLEPLRAEHHNPVPVSKQQICISCPACPFQFF